PSAGPPSAPSAGALSAGPPSACAPSAPSVAMQGPSTPSVARSAIAAAGISTVRGDSCPGFTVIAADSPERSWRQMARTRPTSCPSLPRTTAPGSTLVLMLLLPGGMASHYAPALMASADDVMADEGVHVGDRLGLLHPLQGTHRPFPHRQGQQQREGGSGHEGGVGAVGELPACVEGLQHLLQHVLVHQPQPRDA